MTPMWIVVIAWMYVAVMMAVAEAFGPQGSILGGLFTLLLYGVAPLALVIYLMNTPMRRRRLREAEAPAAAAQASAGRACASRQPPRPLGEVVRDRSEE